MSLYIIGMLLLGGFLFYKTIWGKENEGLYYLAVFILFFVMFGLRSPDVGTDTASYLKYFHIYGSQSLSSLLFGSNWFKSMEPGFIIFTKAISLISSQDRFYLLVIGAIISGLIVSLLKEKNDNQKYILAFLLYTSFFILSCLNLLRQGIAALLLMNAVLSLKNDKIGKGILFIILGLLFHYAGIVLLLCMVPYLFARKGKSFIDVASLFALVVFSFGVFLYIFYLSDYAAGAYSTADGGDTVFSMAILACTVIAYLLSKDNKRQLKLEDNKYYGYIKFLENTLWLAVISCVAAYFNGIFIRFYLLMIPFVCLLICEFSDSQHKYFLGDRAKAYSTFATLCMIIYFAHSLMANIGGIVPWSF